MREELLFSVDTPYRQPLPVRGWRFGPPEEKSLAVIDFVQVYSRLEQRSLRLPLAGLDPARRYRCQKTGQVLSGAGWMYGGLPLPKLKGDYLSCLIVLEAVEG